MAAVLKLWRQIKNPIPFRQSMHIYVKNIRAKFRPNQIWNDGGLGFCWGCRPNNKKNNDINEYMIHAYVNL